MHIQRVLLEGVGSLGNVDTDFQARGINLVLGPNESGKSTLCEAMVAIVYGFGRGESASRRAWNAAADDPYAGTLWIERDGTVYTLRRAFDSDQVLLTRRRADGSEETLVEGNANPRGRTEECRANCQAIREILCLPSEELLRASTHVGQLKAEVELDDELRQQISGAGQSDYRRAEAALEAQYYDLTVVPLPGDGRRRQPRLIEELEGRIEELCARKQAAERVVAQLREEQEQRDRHRQQYDDLEKQLNATTATERALTDYLERLEERERLDVEADRAQQYAERLNRYRRMVEDAEQQLTASELATLGSLRPEQRRSLERYVTSGAEQDLRKREAFEERLNRCTQRLADARLQPMARAPEDTGPLLEQLRRCREHVERLGDAVQAERPKGRPVGTAILFAVVLGIVGLLVAASAGLVLKRDALALAIVTLREAVEQYQGEHLERLGAMMGEYFARFTLSCAHHDQQRYVGVHIGEDHRIEALHASGEMLLPDHLSVGARDQLYLALRLAVTDLIVQDMPLPLLLDDPFVNFDAQRREAALDVLAHIARDRQVILLSHDAVYARWAERVIDLANGRAAA